MTGESLGTYRVIEPLGEGKTGKVYRAADPTLGREVAIKVLAAEVVDDERSLARFQREARALASLNHPNIAVIHELGEADGSHFLVLELVVGETLADKLERGRMAEAEVLDVARQLAGGLESAHARGIIHRDLKPSNVMITPEGRVKILDFGLAKILVPVPRTELSELTTEDSGITSTGTIVGTVPYMSPEQVRGLPLDKRTDIWSFGCLLYEMLTGSRPFAGESASDTLVAILDRQPDWSALAEDTSPRVGILLQRCLRKPRDRRLRDIGDALVELEEPAGGSWDSTADDRTGPRESDPGGARGDPVGWMDRASGPAAVLAALVLASGVLAWILTSGSSEVVPNVSRSVILLDPETPLERGAHPTLAVSPDGRHLAFVARWNRNTWLFLRPIDALQARPIPGTEGALAPFFSPDGQWIAYFTVDGKLKKVPVQGGEPLTLCDAPLGMSGTWGADGTIIFTGSPTAGLSRVSEDGGAVTAVTTPDTKAGEMSHRWPQYLPDGKTILYTSWSNRGRIMALSLDTGETTAIVGEGTFARYLPSGHLVFVAEGSLVAVAFDPESLETQGGIVPVEGSIAIEDSGAAHYDFSRNGILAYVPGGEVRRSLVRLDHQGNSRELVVEPRAYLQPRLSPGGERLLLGVRDSGRYDLWVYNLQHERISRLTFDEHSVAPVWGPAGGQVTFAVNRAPDRKLVTMPIDAAGSPETLYESKTFLYPTDWSPDGDSLFFTLLDEDTGLDLWTYSASEDAARPFIQTRFNEFDARFSPDGGWIAYESTETGRSEVYVAEYPGPGARFTVSSDGGSQPAWSTDGTKIYYRLGQEMSAATVEAGANFELRDTETLFGGPYTTWYDVDDTGFLLVRSELGSGPTRLNLVQGWFQELRRLLPDER